MDGTWVIVLLVAIVVLVLIFTSSTSKSSTGGIGAPDPTCANLQCSGAACGRLRTGDPARCCPGPAIQFNGTNYCSDLQDAAECSFNQQCETGECTNGICGVCPSGTPRTPSFNRS